MLLQVGRKIMRLEDFLGYGEDNSPVKPRQRWGLGAKVNFWLSSNPTKYVFASQSFDLLHEGQVRLEPSCRSYYTGTYSSGDPFYGKASAII